MERINRLMTNICSKDLKTSRNFYVSLFDFNIDYDSDWFVHLVSKDRSLELGIILQSSELIPDEFQKNPQGFYITFVVENIDNVFQRATSKAYEIIREPHDTFYGQRRMLLKDPNGALVDVSSPI